MSDSPSSDDGWEELQRAGRTALRSTGRFIGRSINRAASLARDTRKAFEQGLDANIEDARIVDEYERESERSRR